MKISFLEIWSIKLLICKIERASAKISASGGHFFGKVLKKIKGEKNYVIFDISFIMRNYCNDYSKT